jgi:hypothetical protein
MGNEIVTALLGSKEPSVRLKILANVLGEKPTSNEVQKLQKAIRSSKRAKALLSGMKKDGRTFYHPYSKWVGPHWVLADLADMGYPPGDRKLLPLRELVYEWLLGAKHEKKIKAIDGRVRRCASQEGNALFYCLKLGLADSRTDELADRLIGWQWPDGGWNCDKNPKAMKSSFMESLLPLRGLSLYAKLTGSRRARQAARRAAEIFLKRALYKRQSDGNAISEDFTRLHYPCYWHYDILFGLKVMAEAGLIRDKRCNDALDVLESKRLPDGGFPAEHKYYRATPAAGSQRSAVDWGGKSKRRTNEFVTADALHVLKTAGRFSVRSV